MKLIRFLLMVSMLVVPAVQAAPSLPCLKMDKYAPLVIEGRISIPEKIYHYGEKDVLMKDIQARTVPAEDWERFVMGRGVDADPGKYDLKPIRRGLYGTDGLDTNSFMFGNRRWLMEIHIAEACRDPKYLGSVYAIPDDPRFKKWFDSATDLPVRSWEEAKQCVPRHLPDFVRFIWMNKVPETACENLIGRFLDEAEIKIVMDDEVDRSLYIRDRSCIETISGTPEELLDILGSNADLWTHGCGGVLGIGASNSPALLLEILSSIDTSPKAETLDKIRALNRTAWYAATSSDEQEFIGREAVVTILDAFERCQRKGTLEPFQAMAREFSRQAETRFYAPGSRDFLNRLAGICLS